MRHSRPRPRLLAGLAVLAATAAMLLIPAQQATAKADPECAAGGIKVSAGASPATVTVNDTTTSTGVQVQVTISGTTFTITPTDATVTLDSASWCLKASTETQTGTGTAGTSTILNGKGVAQKVGYLVIYSVGTPTCYESPYEGLQDAAFVGPIGDLDNWQIYHSFDGTCTGTFLRLTVVSATTEPEAQIACSAFDAVAFQLYLAWPVSSSDWWYCS